MRSIELFTPLEFGPRMTLPNRIVMAPMTRSRAGAGGVPTLLNAAYYVQRASAGLIITEGAQVSPEGVGYIATPGIHSNAQVEGWRRVTGLVHAAGGRIFLQLWHVGRISHPALQPEGAAPVAPSAVAGDGQVFTPEGFRPVATPRALDTQEVAGVVEQFRRGAVNALRAGFDGVELHGANGYLIDQFLQIGSNLRTDSYGGSLLNRVRFLLEVVEAVVDVWGEDRVGVRLSPSGTMHGMRDPDRLRTFGYAVEVLAAFPLAYLHIIEAFAQDRERGVDLPTAELRRRWPGRLLVNNGYDGPRASRAVAEGAADFVSFGAPFIANPDLPRRLLRGAPLALPDRATFYGGGAEGYTDYPTLEAADRAATA